MEDSSQGRSLARLTVMIFAPVLVATGVGGYLIPPDLALMSGETPYNLFHLFFGAIGLGLLAVPGDRAVRIYLVGFGTLDLYQALASWLDLWPQALFAWTWVDDVAHVGIGIALVALGLIRRGSVDQ